MLKTDNNANTDRGGWGGERIPERGGGKGGRRGEGMEAALGCPREGGRTNDRRPPRFGHGWGKSHPPTDRASSGVALCVPRRKEREKETLLLFGERRSLFPPFPVCLSQSRERGWGGSVGRAIVTSAAAVAAEKRLSHWSMRHR